MECEVAPILLAHDLDSNAVLECENQDAAARLLQVSLWLRYTLLLPKKEGSSYPRYDSLSRFAITITAGLISSWPSLGAADRLLDMHLAIHL